MLDFEAMFDAYNEANQKEWGHDRNATLGASEVFDCIRKAWFKKRGAEKGFKPDPEFVNGWGATTRGDIIENHHAVPVLKSQLPKRNKLLGAGKKQQTLIVGKNSATPDGLITGLAKDALKKYGIDDIEGDCILVEIKSIDPRISLRKPKEVHFGQVQQQMGIIRTRSPLKPMYAVILYFNASFLDDMKVFPVRFDEKVWASCQERADLLYRVEAPSQLIAEGRMEPGGCDYCPFRGACDAVMVGRHPKDGGPADDPKVIEKIRELAGVREDIVDERKRLERQEAVATEELKEYLRDKKVKGIRESDLSITYVLNEGRTTLNREAMEKAGIDLTPFEKKGSPFETLRVTHK